MARARKSASDPTKLRVPEPFNAGGSITMVAAEHVDEVDRAEFLLLMNALGIAPQSYEDVLAASKKKAADDEDDEDAEDAEDDECEGDIPARELRLKPPASRRGTRAALVTASAQRRNTGAAARQETAAEVLTHLYSGPAADALQPVPDPTPVAPIPMAVAPAPSKYYPVYPVPTKLVGMRYNYSRFSYTHSLVKTNTNKGVALVAPRIGKLRAVKFADIVHDTGRFTTLSRRLCDSCYSLGFRDDNHIQVVTGVLVAGVHFDVDANVLKNEKGWTIHKYTDDGVDDDLLEFRVGSSRMVFAGRRDAAQAWAIFDYLTIMPISDDAFTALWARGRQASLEDELTTAADRLATLRRSLQSAVIKHARIAEMTRLMRIGGVQALREMVAQLMLAGFASSRFTIAGITVTTHDLYMNLGDHETERNDRYIGRFEFFFGLSDSIAMRNIASPYKTKFHPVFDGSTCLGGFYDTLVNCFAASDYHTLGLTLLAMTTHFSPAYNDYIKGWPKEKPEKTFVGRRQTIFGEYESFDNQPREEADGDEEDD